MAATTSARTDELALAFAQAPDPALLADDAIFAFAEANDETGQAVIGREIHGPEAIGQALDFFYRHAGTVHSPAVVGAGSGGRAMVEIAFRGSEIGGFFGLATASEPVIVPCAMVLTVTGGRIATGYLAFDLELLRRRVGAPRVRGRQGRRDG